MDVVLNDIKSFSEKLTSTTWKFNPTYKQECKTLLKQAAFLCVNDSWIRRLHFSSDQSDIGTWWKHGICNGFAIVLVRVYSLLEDCRYSQQPTFEYSARDFWSLWLELSWYNKLVVSSSSQLSEINYLDMICLQDHDSEDCRSRTKDSCEIAGEGMFSFRRVIRDPGNLIGLVREVALKDIEGRTFACKCIAPDGLQEIDIHLKLDHPNVVRVKGWCQTGVVTPYLVTELMDSDLRKWVKDQHPLRAVEGSRFKKESTFHFEYMVVAIDILHQIAQGMWHAHKCNLAHRDLKTENVLVREEWYEGRRMSYFMTAKLTDFGSSKQNVNGLFTTEKVGTRTFRAPEVMKAIEWGKYSSRADVWSFGVLAWEVLTGEEPTTGDGKLQKWPKAQRGWIHPYLVGCIQSCWEIRPGKRPSFEAICIVMQHLKRSMFRNKGIYHASAAILAGKSLGELAKEYQMYQKGLDKWWMTVLVNDLQPSKPLLPNPQGCHPRKVNQFLKGIFDGSLSQHSFLIYEPNSSQHMLRLNSGLSSSSTSCSLTNDSRASPFQSVNGINGSFGRVSCDDDDPVAQELCSQEALYKAASEACSFVEDTVEVCPKELSNSIHLLFRQLAARLHQR